jgi:hypothetical protein
MPTCPFSSWTIFIVRIPRSVDLSPLQVKKYQPTLSNLETRMWVDPSSAVDTARRSRRQLARSFGWQSIQAELKA